MLRDCHCERSLRSNLLVTRGLLRAQTARPRNDSRVWLRLCRARLHASRLTFYAFHCILKRRQRLRDFLLTVAVAQEPGLPPIAIGHHPPLD